MENEEMIPEINAESEEAVSETAEDSTQALLEEYDRKRKNKPDDVIATQAVVCILIGLLMFVANMLYPDITGELFARLRELTTDSVSVIPNPIDLLADCIDKL